MSLCPRPAVSVKCWSSMCHVDQFCGRFSFSFTPPPSAGTVTSSVDAPQLCGWYADIWVLLSSWCRPTQPLVSTQHPYGYSWAMPWLWCTSHNASTWDGSGWCHWGDWFMTSRSVRHRWPCTHATVTECSEALCHIPSVTCSLARHALHWSSASWTAVNWVSASMCTWLCRCVLWRAVVELWIRVSADAWESAPCWLIHWARAGSCC